ncbi:MAG: tetratricopeptide repeat protein, partial [Anaerolineae bacterium]|nr:tetratricopeptide repeat protein [Anaerolineae bacterium]
MDTPQTADDYFEQGKLYYLADDYPKAIENYTQAIALNPNYHQAYNNRGDIHRLMGDYDSALADFEQAIRLNPTDYYPYYNSSHVYYRLGNYDNALTQINQAISLEMLDEEAYFLRACIYMKQYKPSFQQAMIDLNHAITDLSKVIFLNPAHVDAYNNRGMCYLNIEQL